MKQFNRRVSDGVGEESSTNGESRNERDTNYRILTPGSPRPAFIIDKLFRGRVTVPRAGILVRILLFHFILVVIIIVVVVAFQQFQHNRMRRGISKASGGRTVLVVVVAAAVASTRAQAGQ